VVLLIASGGQTAALHAQQSSRDLLIHYVPPSVTWTNTIRESIRPVAAPPRGDPTVVLIGSKGVAADQRREKFEAEFGIQQPSSSFLKGSLQTMKYNMDDALFTVKDFIEQNLNFRYQLRNLTRAEPATAPPRRRYDSLLLDAWENARFESHISLSAGAQDPIGVRLVVPIGN
jgi:hypothetical protein